MKDANGPLLLRYFVGALILRTAAAEVQISGNARRNKNVGGTPLHKVLLTQKGYIQFLRWEIPVPSIEEFTFCLWFESTNLTHSHPIFSYSKNERDRLVRSWISPGGKSVHLEIGDREVFKQNIRIQENRWYHVCQSWENRMGSYALWIDGRIVAQDQHDATRGHIIPSAGDIVLGQEYTDFDKGLADGIEGAVLGFNLLLASAFASPYDGGADARSDENARYEKVCCGAGTSGVQPYVPPPYIQLPFEMRRQSLRARKYRRSIDFKTTSRRRHFTGVREWMSDETTLKNDPLGLQLVKLSYVRCELGRASPRVGGSSMLISWSRTPVRVFGGAVLKNAPNDCGHF